MGTLGSMQLKLSAGPVARTPPFPHPPTCPPASPASTSTTSPTYLPTCIHINYIYCIHHLPTPPTSYPTAPATTRPPLLLLTSGVQHTPRRPRPRPAACPCSGLPSPRCLKCQATDLTTLDAIPINHRKRIFSSPTSFLHRLLLSVPSQPDRPHDCMLPCSHHRTRSTASTPHSLTVLITALTTTVFVASVPLFASQGTPHSPQPPRALLSPCPPARTCTSTSRPG